MNDQELVDRLARFAKRLEMEGRYTDQDLVLEGIRIIRSDYPAEYLDNAASSLPPDEAMILNQQDPSQVICKTCGATLGQYRTSQKCTAPLGVSCEGFERVETLLKSA